MQNAEQKDVLREFIERRAVRMHIRAVRRTRGLSEIDNLFNRDYCDYAAYGKNPTPRPINRSS